MEKLIIKNARRKNLPLLLACIAFVAIGVIMLVRGQWFGWITILFFGSCLLVYVWQIIDARPRLVIDERGVLDRTLGIGRIRWSDIEHAYVVSLSSADFICLELRNSEKYLRRLSKVKRALAKANRHLGMTDFSLNLYGVNATAEEVFELVIKFCELSRRDQAPLTEPCDQKL